MRCKAYDAKRTDSDKYRDIGRGKCDMRLAAQAKPIVSLARVLHDIPLPRQESMEWRVAPSQRGMLMCAGAREIRWTAR